MRHSSGIASRSSADICCRWTSGGTRCFTAFTAAIRQAWTQPVSSGSSCRKAEALSRQGTYPLFLRPLRRHAKQRRQNTESSKHDPDKWALFKTYCKGDVTTEMEIDRRLSNFPVPADIEKQWQTDLPHQREGCCGRYADGARGVGNRRRLPR